MQEVSASAASPHLIDKVIHGRTDGRHNLDALEAKTDLDPVACQKVREASRSVACLVHHQYLTFNESKQRYMVMPDIERLRNRLIPSESELYPVGEDERFRDEICLGRGTAFLVAKDYLLTAAHCFYPKGAREFNRRLLERTWFVFDFQMGDQLHEFEKSSVYRFKHFLAPSHPGKEDWMLIQLDRDVGRDPIQIDFDWQVALEQKVCMLGHPLGLPIKYTGGATVRSLPDEQPKELKTDLDAFEGNSGSPILVYHSDKQKLFAVAMLIRGERDFRIDYNYQKKGVARAVSRCVNDRRWETGIQMARLDFLIDLLPSLAAAPIAGHHAFKPGLSLEGPCPTCLDDRVVIPFQLNRADVPVFNIDRLQFESRCPESHSIPWQKVDTVVLSQCFYGLEGYRIVEELERRAIHVHRKGLLLEEMVLRLDRGAWGYLEIQAYPVLRPLPWKESCCQLRETVEGPVFTLACDAKSTRDVPASHVRGWIFEERFGYRDPHNPSQWHPLLREATPCGNIASLTLGLGVCEVEGGKGKVVGYCGDNGQLSWVLLEDRGAEGLDLDRVMGLPAELTGSAPLDELVARARTATRDYSCKVYRQPLRLKFVPLHHSVAESVVVPDRPLPEELQAFHHCLARGDLENALDYLMVGALPRVNGATVEGFICAVFALQRNLCEQGDLRRTRDWIYHKLLKKLWERAVPDQGMAVAVIDNVQREMEGVPETPEGWTLKIDGLMLLYSLSCCHEMRARQVDLITDMAKVCAQLNDLVLALRYLNIAHGFDPQNHAVQVELSQFESKAIPEQPRVVEGLGGECSFDCTRTAAELCVEYGKQGLAKGIYSQLVQRTDGPLQEEVRRRWLEIGRSANPPLPRGFDWQRRRANLRAIRHLIESLFRSALTQRPAAMPRIDPSFSPVVKSCLDAENLVPMEEDRDALLGLPSVEQVCRLQHDLIRGFVASLYEQAVLFHAPPPCRYALVGIEVESMACYSGFSAVVLVDEKTPTSVHYFEQVGFYFELLMLNLGETRTTLGSFPHLEPGLCLESLPFHPSRVVEVTDQAVLLPYQTSLITGDADFLEAFQQRSGGTKEIGEELLGRWQSPPPLTEQVAVEKALLVPLRELIRGLGLKYNVLARSTSAVLTGIEPHVPPDFASLCRSGLALAHRLQLRAHLHHGRRCDHFDLLPADDHPHPCLLTYQEWKLLEEVHSLLFQACDQMNLIEGVDEEVWEQSKLSDVRRLMDQERMVQAAEAFQRVSRPPADLGAILALWQGDLERAAVLDRHASELDYGSGLSRAIEWDYPSSQRSIFEFNRLWGQLQVLKMRRARRWPAPPPASIFTGEHHARCCALWRYLTGMRLGEDARARAWECATRCFAGDSMPGNEEELYAALYPIANPTRADLLYGDLVVQLRSLLGRSHDPATLLSLFSLSPREMRPRVVQELREAKVDLHVVDALRGFPESDGRRLLGQRADPVLNLQQFAGDCEVALTPQGMLPISLSPEAAAFLISLASGESQSCSERHFVNKMLGVYFKVEPEYAGRAHGYSSLYKLITGRCFPASRVCCLDWGARRLVVTTSVEVPGRTLQEVLEHDPQVLQGLDFHHYCWEGLMALITFPEDAKPDNWIVFVNVDGRVLLVNIDFDRVFVDPLKKMYWGMKKQMQCKSILFCMDEMRQPLDPLVRAAFLELKPVDVLRRWLDEVERYNADSVELFGEAVIDRGLKANPIVEIPFPVEPADAVRGRQIRRRGLLFDLYDRMCRLQRVLREDPNSSLLDLLRHLEPELYLCYCQELDIVDRNPLRRFVSVTNGLYQRKRGEIASHTYSRLPQSQRSWSSYLQEGWTVENARTALDRIHYALSGVGPLVEELLTRNGDGVRLLNIPEFSDDVVRQIDFGELSRAQQQHVLNRITGLQFKKLHLTRCSVLSDGILEQLLRHCPNLRSLNLQGSQGITHLDYLERLCPKIQTLIVRDVSTLQRLAQIQKFGERHVPGLGYHLLLETVLAVWGIQALWELRFSESYLEGFMVFFRYLWGNACTSAVIPVWPLPALCQSGGPLGKLVFLTLYIWAGNHGLGWVCSKVIDSRFIAPRGIRITGIYCRQTHLTKPLRLPQLRRIDFSNCSSLGFVHLDALHLRRLYCSDIRMPEVFTVLSHNLEYVEVDDQAVFDDLSSGFDLTGFQFGDTRVHYSPPNISAQPAVRALYVLESKVVQGESNEVLLSEMVRQQLTSAREPEAVIRVVTPDRTRRFMVETQERSGEIETRVGHLVSQYGRQIRRLVLRHSSLNQRACTEILRSCPSLAYLETGQCPHMSGEALLLAAATSVGLRSLDLSGCDQVSDAIVEQFSLNATHLAALNLSDCLQLRQVGPTLRRLSSLTRLNLSGCSGLDEESFGAIVDTNTSLQDLCLNRCVGLTDDALQTITQRSPHLRHLGIAFNWRIEDQVLSLIGQYSTGLVSLDIHGRLHVSSQALRAILAGCGQLQLLRLGHCDTLAYRAFEGATQLRDLDLSECRRLSMKEVVALSRYCTSLTRLDLSNCSRLEQHWRRELWGGMIERLRTQSHQEGARFHFGEVLRTMGYPWVHILRYFKYYGWDVGSRWIWDRVTRNEESISDDDEMPSRPSRGPSPYSSFESSRDDDRPQSSPRLVPNAFSFPAIANTCYGHGIRNGGATCYMNAIIALLNSSDQMRILPVEEGDKGDPKATCRHRIREQLGAIYRALDGSHFPLGADGVIELMRRVEEYRRLLGQDGVGWADPLQSQDLLTLFAFVARALRLPPIARDRDPLLAFDLTRYQEALMTPQQEGTLDEIRGHLYQIAAIQGGENLRLRGEVAPSYQRLREGFLAAAVALFRQHRERDPEAEDWTLREGDARCQRALRFALQALGLFDKAHNPVADLAIAEDDVVQPLEVAGETSLPELIACSGLRRHLRARGEELPPILPLYLDRGTIGQRNQSPVTGFNEPVSLYDRQGIEHRYQIEKIVIYTGAHYYVCVRRLHRLGRWLVVNDARVEEVGFEKIAEEVQMQSYLITLRRI